MDEVFGVAFGSGEGDGDIAAIELDPTRDGGKEVFAAIRGGGIGVIHLHGKGDQGSADIVVGQGQATILCKLPQISGKSGDHAIGVKLSLYTGFVAYKVFEEISFWFD